MADIALVAGVSIKTVSRVVNKDKGVGLGKRQQIERLVAEFNFAPNPSARTLSSEKSQPRSFNIGLLTDRGLDRFYIGALQMGAGKACQSAGYHLIVEDVSASAASDRTALDRMLLQMKLDGAIMAPGLENASDLYGSLSRLNVPVATVSPSCPKTATLSVQIDEQGAAYAITNYLVSAGHRKIALVIADKATVGMRERKKGYLNCLVDAGLPINSSWICDEAPQAIEDLLSDPRGPTAIFAATDRLAFRTMAMAAKTGRIIPDDISLVGFGDGAGAEAVWPPLTTVHEPVADFGAVAVSLLLRRLGGPLADQQSNVERLGYAIVERQSVKCFGGAG